MVSKDLRYLVFGVVSAGYMTIFYDVSNYVLEHGLDEKFGIKVILGLISVGVGIGVIYALRDKKKGD